MLEFSRKQGVKYVAMGLEKNRAIVSTGRRKLLPWRTSDDKIKAKPNS